MSAQHPRTLSPTHCTHCISQPLTFSESVPSIHIARDHRNGWVIFHQPDSLFICCLKIFCKLFDANAGNSGYPTWVRLQQLQKQRYPVPPLYKWCYLVLPCSEDYRSVLSRQSDFDFQLSRGTLQEQPEAHRSNMLFFFTQRTRYSAWYTHQTNTKMLQNVLLQRWVLRCSWCWCHIRIQEVCSNTSFDWKKKKSSNKYIYV